MNLELRVMSFQRQQINAVIRFWAGGCALLWLVGVGICDLDRISNGSHPHTTCQSHAGHLDVRQIDHDHDIDHGIEHPHGHTHVGEHGTSSAQHYADTQSENQSRRSNENDCDANKCCSTLEAFFPTTHPIVFDKPVLHFPGITSPPVIVSTTSLSLLKPSPARQADRLKWVFTPVVCLGPAFRSHAPPPSLL